MQKVTNAELYRRIDLTENLMEKIITRKLELFGHICRMENDRQIKSVVFGRELTKEGGHTKNGWTIFIHSFILNIYIAPLQENYSEALPTPARSNKAVLR